MSTSAADKAFLALRDKVKLNPVRQIRLSFELDVEDSPDSQLVAVMRCVTCDEGFAWSDQPGWWTCLSCGIELTPSEASDFMVAAKKALKALNTDVGKKKDGRWDWVLRLLRLGRAAR